MVEVIQRAADCRAALAAYDDESIDAIVSDPPAGINFMGRSWDKSDGFIDFMTEVFTLAYAKMKPGAHGLIWALPRTQHWTMTALENSGFEIRDVVMHIFGSGFPKNYDVAKGIEAKLTTGSANWNGFRNLAGQSSPPEAGLGGFSKAAADAGYRPESYTTGGRLALEPTTDLAGDFMGFGTALKPAYESWILIKKPHKGSVADCAIKYGTGAINIGATRVGTETREIKKQGNPFTKWSIEQNRPAVYESREDKTVAGRWPSNLVLSHSFDCRRDWPEAAYTCAPDCPVAELNRQSGISKSDSHVRHNSGASKKQIYALGLKSGKTTAPDDSGGASRFYPTFEYDDADRLAIFGYFAKPSTAERNAGLDDLAAKPKVFNGQAAAASKSVAAGSVEDKFSTQPARNHHPTVKSTALMSWLIRLVTPPARPDGSPPLVVDLFAGSGSGGVAAVQIGGVRWHGFDLDPEYVDIAQRRIAFAALPKEIQTARRDQYYIDWSTLD